MTSSDLNVLLDMGFDQERASIAVKKSGGLQGALQWLEDNQDKSLDDINTDTTMTDANDETNPSIEPAALTDGEVAKSMVCNECGKKFRSMAQAQAHAERTEHTDFAESAEEIAPLTDAEKKEKLEELRQRAAEKKSKQALVDKEEAKANEKIRMKSTKEIQDAKEELAKKEQIKAASKKRQEKAEDLAAKRRIQDKIAADKETRRLKAEALKAEREGKPHPQDPSLVAAQSAQAAAGPSTSTAGGKKIFTEARLRLQTPTGVIQKTFPVDTTLFEVGQALAENMGGAEVESFTMTYPKKTFNDSVDFGKTLKKTGLTPNTVLIVK